MHKYIHIVHVYIHTNIHFRFITYIILYIHVDKTLKPPKPISMKKKEQSSLRKC